MDEFKSELIKLRDSHRESEKDFNGGIGIRPIHTESKLKADLIDTIIKLYDKHFPVNKD